MTRFYPEELYKVLRSLITGPGSLLLSTQNNNYIRLKNARFSSEEHKILHETQVEDQSDRGHI